MGSWGLWAGALVLVLGAGCGGAASPGESLACDDTRVALDCSSEVAYQGVATEGGVEILSVGDANARYEEQAIRRVNDELGRYVAVQTRLCREYNACVLTREQYLAETKATREAFSTAADLAAKVKAAPAGATRRQALGELYRSVVPEQGRPEELTLTVTMDAELPASVGGGRIVVEPGAPLPTNAHVQFRFVPSAVAYLYVFQKTPGGEVNVLFPHAGIGTKNPAAAGAEAQVPPGGQRFRVNEKDLGTENVYIVASRKPLDTLGKAVAELEGGGRDLGSVTRSLSELDASPSGDCGSRALELVDAKVLKEACAQSRGIAMRGAPDSGASMQVTTDPGDGVIVRVFSFLHVDEQTYAGKKKEFELEPRGIIIED